MTVADRQLLLDIFDCDATLLGDVELVARATRGAALAAGGSIVQESFRPLAGGVAGVVLVTDGQLSVRTDPARGYAAVDLHGSSIVAERCFDALRAILRGGRTQLIPVERGAPPPPAPPAYQPLHPALFRYDDGFVARFIDPSVARVTRAGAAGSTREICEQLYQFRLFTPEFCRLLIEEAEHCGEWVTVLEHTVEKHGVLAGVDDLIEPDTSLSWARMPPLVDVYREVIENHVRPVVEGLWQTFKLQKWDIPGVRKYEPDVVKGMDLHYDAETVGMIGYLSDGFTGGGTHFPRWNATVGSSGAVVIGSVVVYPGGVSHEHLALPITAGRRYTLSNALY